MNVGQALLPTLWLQQGYSAVSGWALDCHITKPQEKSGIVRDHVQNADRGPAEVISDPGRYQHQLHRGETTKSQSHSEAVLPARNAHVVRKEKQKQDHPDLD